MSFEELISTKRLDLAFPFNSLSGSGSGRPVDE